MKYLLLLVLFFSCKEKSQNYVGRIPRIVSTKDSLINAYEKMTDTLLASLKKSNTLNDILLNKYNNLYEDCTKKHLDANYWKPLSPDYHTLLKDGRPIKNCWSLDTIVWDQNDSLVHRYFYDRLNGKIVIKELPIQYNSDTLVVFYDTLSPLFKSCIKDPLRPVIDSGGTVKFLDYAN